MLDGLSGIAKRQRRRHLDAIERVLFNWVNAQFIARVCLSGSLIQEKGTRLLANANLLLPPESRIKLNFSNGWLQKFQRRWQLKSWKLHGESGDADNEAMESKLPSIQERLKPYELRDIYNADEFGLFYRMAPDKTIAREQLEGRKKDKKRLSVLACSNADGSHKVPLLIIGNAHKPRFFKGKTGHQLGFDYHSNKKAWMTTAVFFDWLKRFDDYIGMRPGGKPVLLLDNCSAHGTDDTILATTNVEVIFLPPNTTSKLQPMDAGIIAAMKLRYRKLQMERAVDLLDVNVKDIYKVDQLTAMWWMVNVWQELLLSIITNCWLHSRLLDKKLDHCVVRSGEGGTAATSVIGIIQSNEARDIQTEIEEAVAVAVPPGRRMSIGNLLNPEQEDNCIEIFNDEEMAGSLAEEILGHGSGDELEEECEDVDDQLMPSVKVQLQAVAVVKCLVDRYENNGDALSILRRLQRGLRCEKMEAVRQTTLDEFFQ